MGDPSWNGDMKVLERLLRDLRLNPSVVERIMRDRRVEDMVRFFSKARVLFEGETVRRIVKMCIEMYLNRSRNKII